nr:MAG: hypothetical protein [Narnaviridae sp.]
MISLQWSPPGHEVYLMSKTITKKQSSQKKSTPRTKKRITTGPRPTLYQQILMDPCNGPVVSILPGESGIVQRFVYDFTVNTETAARTCGYIFFSPAANQGVKSEFDSPGLAGSPNAFSGPGSAFLAANARKIRAISCCVSVIPSAVSYNTMTGEIAVANASYNSIEASGSYSVNGVFTLANTRSVLSKRTYDVKWSPQLLDGTYAPVSTLGTATLSDPSDHNGILVAYRGYPAGVALNLRITTNIEWTPSANLGIAVSSSPRPPGNYMGEASSLFRANPHWWHDLFGDVTSHIFSELGKGAKYMASLGVRSGVRYATSAFPMLTM